MGGFFPAASIGANQQQGFIGNLAQVLAVRNEIQRSSLQSQQIQQAQIQTQQAQLQLNQTRALNDSFKNAYSVDPTTGQPTFNEAGIYQQLASAGAGALIPGLRESFLKMNTAAADLQEKQTAVQAAHRDYLAEGLYAITKTKDPTGHYDPNVIGSVLAHYAQVDPQGAANIKQQLSQLDPAGADRMIDSLVQSSPKVQELMNQAITAQGALARGKAAGEEARIAGEKLKLEQQAQPGKLALTQAQTVQERALTQKTLLETQNLGQLPIFALDKSSSPPQRVLTTRAEATANGWTNPVPVNETAIKAETTARAMVNDVQLNKSRYQAALDQMVREPMSDAQKTALVALTPEKLGIEIGHGFGINLPDVIQHVTNATAFSALSDTQAKAVLGYYTTLASVPALQKALTETGKQVKEVMEMELRTIPTPIMDKRTQDMALERYQGNIDQTASKTVRIPGMADTKDIRAQYEPKFAQTQRPNIPTSIGDLLNQFNAGRKPKP